MTAESDSLKRFLAFSVAFHGALIIALILRGTVLSSPPKMYIPSLRVDLVALPDLKKNDLPPTKEETLVEKPKDAETKLDVKPVDQGDISLKKKKDLSRKEKEAQARLKNAIDRIKALERIKAMTGQQVKGNAISKGSALSGDAKISLETTYYDVVLERVRNYWELPKWLQEQDLSAQVKIFIDRQGQMIRYEMTRASGNASFDAEVKRTLQSAVPFPAPPIAIIPDVSGEGILLGFPI